MTTTFIPFPFLPLYSSPMSFRLMASFSLIAIVCLCIYKHIFLNITFQCVSCYLYVYVLDWSFSIERSIDMPFPRGDSLSHSWFSSVACTLCRIEALWDSPCVVWHIHWCYRLVRYTKHTQSKHRGVEPSHNEYIYIHSCTWNSVNVAEDGVEKV